MEKLISDFQAGITQRLPTPAERAELAGLVGPYEAALTPASPSAIDGIVASLSAGYRAEKVSAEEADARLNAYQIGLADVPLDILEHAALRAMRECRFFPVVEEIRSRCDGLALRAFRLARIKHLIDRHDREWRPEPDPEPPLNAADQAKVDGWLKQHGIAA